MSEETILSGNSESDSAQSTNVSESKVSKESNWLDTLFSVSKTFFTSICCICLIIQVAVVFYVVIGRYVFSKTPGWGEPTALFCMVWFSLISSALPLLDDSHLKVTVIEHFLPKKVIDVIDFINLIVSFAFGVFLIVYGFKMYNVAKLSVIAGLGIKSSWLYLSVPVAGLSICMTSLERMVMVWRVRQ